MGDNHNDEKFISEYSANNINDRLIIKRKYPTTKKTRFVLPGQPVRKLFEIYEMDDQMVDDKIESQILDFLNNKIENYDIVIVQDYGHGLITEKIISTLIAKAKFLAVNAQINSGNFGYNLITKYHGATYYCLDLSEARMAINSKYETIQKIPSKICKITKGKFVTVTLGKEGSISCDNYNNICYSPVLGNQIYDTMSAGDAFYALSAPVLCLSQSIQLSALAGNLAAAIKLETPGLKDSIDKNLFIDKLKLQISK
jgi:bifunctional ADP-heptose synthase (sugar kinase/adenylyltransferase)